ncbi:hypothetical protein [Thermus sp.]|uniref:hypothetical protein n=1 Tax=Thermus sp. TaxID=275 RepID=UPI0025D95D69|nr:hypothetical protein [Thermus sp.]MCS6867191.1 hypothetical protein [Thermus sp.]MDW8358500.1 hypothetical protein [Thermus sp.]
MKRLLWTLTVALSPALAQFDWLSGLDWGGISQNLNQVGQVLACDPSALARLDFSQPSLVFRAVYKTTKCVLCTTMKMCGFPDDMLYPASWGEILGALRSGRNVMIVGSGAGVEAIVDYLILALSGGGCQNISYGGVPIYTCPPGGIQIPKAFLVTDARTAKRVKEKLQKARDPNLLKVVAVGGERDSPELARVLLGLPLVWAGGKPYLFAPGYATPDRWLWLTFDGPVSGKVALVVNLATQYVASAAQREEEVR